MALTWYDSSLFGADVLLKTFNIRVWMYYKRSGDAGYGMFITSVSP